MHWKLKGTVQRFLGAIPGGDALHFALQRRVGGLKAFEAEAANKITNCGDMLSLLSSLGVSVRGCAFAEIGTGWYPTFPLFLYAAGARQISTYDVKGLLRPDLTRKCLDLLARRSAYVAEITGTDEAFVCGRLRNAIDALREGVSLEDATEGCIRYFAPRDFAASGIAASSVDVAFSNDVLEHVAPQSIHAIFKEVYRVLRPGGLAIHAVNCGDHYAYSDRRVSQLNYLRYDEHSWSRWNNRFLYQNRWRARDFVDAMRRSGLEIALVRAPVKQRRLDELQAVPVDPCFARYSAEELCVTSLDLAGRKPLAVARAPDQSSYPGCK